MLLFPIFFAEKALFVKEETGMARRRTGQNEVPVSKEDIERTVFIWFAHKGYAATMAEIAHSVGLKPQSLYSHFPGKQVLFEKVIKQELDRYFTAAAALVGRMQPNMPCRSGLRLLFDFTMSYFQEQDTVRFWRQIPLIGRDEALRDLLVEEIKQRDEALARSMHGYLARRGAIEPRLRGNESRILILLLCGIQGALNLKLMCNDEVRCRDMLDRIWNAVEATLDVMEEEPSPVFP